MKPDWYAELPQIFSKLPPSVVALALQFVAFLLVVSGFRFAAVPLNLLLFALICGSIAAALGHLSGLARWWLPIQFLFAPAIVLVLNMQIPSEFFLAAFIVMLVVYWTTFRSQVPLYLSSKRVWKTLEEILPAGHFTFMDIGSGLGGVLTHLAWVRADGQYFGVENAPLPYLISKLRIRLGNHTNCHVKWESMWTCDLTHYDVVFAYLSPVPMAQLWRKAQKEMRPGTLFISNSFAVPQHPPQYSITLDDLHHSSLHIWHM